MTLIARLRRERTNAASKPNLAFYAPGNMTLPYGKLNLTVGGRGSPGNSPVPGTIASYNPPSPGNIASYNPTTPGTFAGYNPSYTAYNPPTLDMIVSVTYFPSAYWGGPQPAPYTQHGYYNDYSHFAPDPADPNLYIASIDVSYTGNFNPGNAYTVPGTVYYNPTIPGTANYNPPVSGNANYNPPVSGTAGSDSYVFGVYFPGGAIGTTAPLVPDTKVSIPYQNAPVAVYVPPGGNVTVKGV